MYGSPGAPITSVNAGMVNGATAAVGVIGVDRRNDVEDGPPTGTEGEFQPAELVISRLLMAAACHKVGD